MALAFLPFTEAQLQRAFLLMILTAGLALAWFIASLAGLPALVGERFAALTANAGFAVSRVTVTGVERMNEQRIYERALVQRNQPMASVDLEALRQELLALSWVADARVSRRLPDMLAIDIVEREPRAVLMKPDRLVLIDGSGHELQPIGDAAARGMLRVQGPGAVRQIEELDLLLDAAPALKPKVKAAEWVGNRRWNLTFDTGQVLALPQDDEAATGALVKFAKLDGTNRLLGGKVASFDMRLPDRIYMRVPGRMNADLQRAADARKAAAVKEAD
jgi:cell division protein FtsQ